MKEETATTPKKDLMNEALKHYEEAAKAINHYNSDIPKAIRLYFTEVPIEPVEAEKEQGAPFDEPIYNPECKECGHQNSVNCNTCDILNPQFR